MTAVVHVGDCREVLKTLPDCSIDAIVTDPPYELGFMGKAWDSTGIAYDTAVWSECLRVLKPGGHLLSFGGSRTYHRMACAIEDAGFEIRDQIMWIYGSGFPKSMDVSKAIDKGTGENRARQLRFTEWMRSTGITAAQINDATGTSMGTHYLTNASQPAIATADLFDLLRPHLPEVPEEIERLVAERTGIEWTAYKQRRIIRTEIRNNEPSGIVSVGQGERTLIERKITAAATDDAKRWSGWGTALKPAHEPIVVARKPLVGTVAANVLAHGVGGLNIDGCRIGGAAGRWPANVIFDEEAGVMLDEQNGISKDGVSTRPTKKSGYDGGWGAQPDFKHTYGGEGGASRFFYCAKASKRDRNEGLDAFEARRDADRVTDDGVGGDNPRNRSNNAKVNHHPTVKPTELMRYLIRLVTPVGGVLLDPFTGSGSTGKAATLENCHFIGIEQNAEYAAIAEARIAHAGGPLFS